VPLHQNKQHIQRENHLYQRLQSLGLKPGISFLEDIQA